MDIRIHRTRFLAGFAAVGLALSSFGPSYAQSAPVLGSWLAGPDAKGSSTIVGRIEAPTARRNVSDATNVQVAGWAADTTATGWAGIDGVEIWKGAKDKGGSKLASGSAGLARNDVGDALGRTFTNSGFSAIVPASAWTGLNAGTNPITLYVYLHTPDKGTWYRTVPINVTTSAGLNLATMTPLTFASDPMVVIARPQEGMNITQKQKNNKFSFNGFALDRNPIVDPKIQLTGPGCSGCNTAVGNIGGPVGAGIANIVAYIDTPPVKGDPSTFGNFGAPCTSCLYANNLVSNAGSLNTPGRPQASITSHQFGSQFDFAGWSISINPATLSPGPHTLYVTATSSVTGSLNAAGQFVGKQTTASVNFNILDLTHTHITPDPLTCGNKTVGNFLC